MWKGQQSTYLASRARANTPAASGAAADVPEWRSVQFPYRSVVAWNNNKNALFITNCIETIGLGRGSEHNVTPVLPIFSLGPTQSLICSFWTGGGVQWRAPSTHTPPINTHIQHQLAHVPTCISNNQRSWWGKTLNTVYCLRLSPCSFSLATCLFHPSPPMQFSTYPMDALHFLSSSHHLTAPPTYTPVLTSIICPAVAWTSGPPLHLQLIPSSATHLMYCSTSFHPRQITVTMCFFTTL